jgi:hypothetical protein
MPWNMAHTIDNGIANKGRMVRTDNPFYRSEETFANSGFAGAEKTVLVSRLDGWSWDDARGLVDNSVDDPDAQAKVFMDYFPGRGWDSFNSGMRDAYNYLNSIDFPVEFDQSGAFRNPGYPMLAYASWGSNDGGFSQSTYNSLGFSPRSFCETAVSSSASNIRSGSGVQSQIATLVRNGVAAAKGYVTEPTTTALANMSIMADRYFGQGWNIIDSYYAASRLIGFKDMVVGDPLMTFEEAEVAVREAQPDAMTGAVSQCGVRVVSRGRSGAYAVLPYGDVTGVRLLTLDGKESGKTGPVPEGKVSLRDAAPGFYIIQARYIDGITVSGKIIVRQ